MTSDVDPNLIHLFLKEKVYVLPEDRPQPVRQAVGHKAIQEPAALLLPTPATRPTPAAAVVKPAETGFILPKLPAKALAILVHHAGSEPLDPALVTMLTKLATATEPDTSLHVHLVGDMSQYTFPQGWHPWPARLTLLLGWPADLLARHRIAEPFRTLRFASAQLIAAPHPADLEADRTLKTRLWQQIQTAKS